jgi:hypothetical protein
MKRLLMILAALPCLASAQPFIELGVGAVTGGCLYNARETVGSYSPIRGGSITPGCSRSPLGLIAVGYQFNDQWRIQWDHWSSIPDTRDRGMEILSIRYRFTFH